MVAAPPFVGVLQPFSFLSVCPLVGVCAPYSYYDLFRFTLLLSIPAGVIALASGLLFATKPEKRLASSILSLSATIVYTYATVSQQIDAGILAQASYNVVQFLPAVLSILGSPILAGGLLTLFPGRRATGGQA